MRFPFVLGLLAAAFLSACATRSSTAPKVTAQREGTQIVFRAGDREMFRYQAEPGELPRPDIKAEFRRGGYIHPVLSPSGKLVTDDFPRNHVHHHGIWAPWTKTKFEGREPDFWNMGQEIALVEFVAVDQVWSEGASAGLTARHRFVDLKAPGGPKAALNETWTIRAFAVEGPRPGYLIDLISTQTCATTSPLELPKYHYGGLGFRGNWAWNGKTNGLYLTSNGDTDRLKINETRGSWAWIGGPVDGGITGTAILCHPSNFRAPQPMRLHPTEPFLCFAPQQLGDMAIKPGEPYVFRYRFVVADGEPDAKLIEQWWKDYAATGQ
jgi:hypothetical protein